MFYQIQKIKSPYIIDMEIKREYIKNLLNDITDFKTMYSSKMRSYKRKDDIFESLLMGCSTIATTNAIFTLSVPNPATLIICASFGIAGTLLTGLSRALSIKSRYESYRTSFNQYSDLEREIRAVLVKNHLDSQDLEILIIDVGHRLSLIEDTSININIKKRK